ncbi:MAG TPA: hypothetical protein VFG34_09230 [Sphingopyxis sp.]|nr:hypothetical protein [Sphingopyxis sp.]
MTRLKQAVQTKAPQAKAFAKAALCVSGAVLAVGGLGAGSIAPAMAQQGGADTAAPPAPRGFTFRLPPAEDQRDNRVQGPSDNGLPPAAPADQQPPRSRPAPTPTPVPAPTPLPMPAPAPAPGSGTVSPGGTKAPPPSANKAPAPAQREEAPRASPVPEGLTPPAVLDEQGGSAEGLAPLPDEVAGVAAESGMAQADAPDEAAPVPASGSALGDDGIGWIGWALAVLAAIGAGIFYWRRQNQVADEDGDGAVVVEADDGPAQRPARPAATASKGTSSAGDSVGQPKAPADNEAEAISAARPRSALADSPDLADSYVTARPLVRRPVDEMRADVGMEIMVRSIRVEVDHVAVGFLLTLTNRGALDAQGLMVRLALGQGSAMNEAVLNRFYDGAGGSVLRDDIALAAGHSEQLSSEAKMPRAVIEPLMMGGKPMLVPVLAADVTYNWDGPGEAFGQIAAAYVLGRAGAGGSDKLAPIPLDRERWAVDRPDGRPTAMARQQ